MRRMSEEDARRVFQQLRKCNSDEEFIGLIRSLKEGNIVKPKAADYIKYQHIESISKSLKYLSDNKVNILLAGTVGSGKSATVNAILQDDVAVVGRGLYPVTTDIKSYVYGKLTLWDTPGLGNDKYSDKTISDNIINMLKRKKCNGQSLIDIVIIVLNSVSCDYMVMSDLFNEILVTNIGEDITSRVVVGLNQCDMLLHRDYWESWNSSPYKELTIYMSDKEQYVEKLIHNTICKDIINTGNRNIKAVCYSAGYKEDDEQQRCSYNIDCLMDRVVKNVMRLKEKYNN